MEREFNLLAEVGEWAEIVRFGKKVEKAIKESGMDKSVLEEWSEWRPRHEDRINIEGVEKTAKSAKVNTKSDSDLTHTKARLKENYKESKERLTRGDFNTVPIRPLVKNFAVVAKDRFKHAFSSFESLIYQRVMLKSNPQYFDSDFVSASLRQVGSDTYRIEVTVSEEYIDFVQDHVQEIKRISDGELTRKQERAEGY